MKVDKNRDIQEAGTITKTNRTAQNPMSDLKCTTKSSNPRERENFQENKRYLNSIQEDIYKAKEDIYKAKIKDPTRKLILKLKKLKNGKNTKEILIFVWY